MSQQTSLPQQAARWLQKPSHDRVLLFVCLSVLLCVCGVVLCTGVFRDPRPQFQLGAVEFLKYHRIAWDFLPVGYAALLGLCYVVGSPWGLAGMQDAAMLAAVAILVLIFFCLRALLREFLPVAMSTSFALLLCLHPELLQALKKVKDDNATLLTVLLVLLGVMALRRRPSLAHSLWSGAAIGLAITIRPNLALLPLLLLWAVNGLRWRQKAGLAACSMITAAAVYCAITAAVHGRPFFPQNGAYNLYAGANPYTERSLFEDRNAESSIVENMRANGMEVRLDWLAPANQPGIRDARDRRFEQYYRKAALGFTEEHPGRAAWLSGLKLANLLRPETNRYHYADILRSKGAAVWLAYRTLAALVVPGWILACAICWRRWMFAPGWPVAWFAAIFILPFMLTNSDPDFRIVLDIVLLMDILRRAYLLRHMTACRMTKGGMKETA